MAVPISLRNIAIAILAVALVPLLAAPPQRAVAQTTVTNPVTVTVPQGQSINSSNFTVNFPTNNSGTAITYTLAATSSSPVAGITIDVNPTTVVVNTGSSASVGVVLTVTAAASVPTSPSGGYAYRLSYTSTGLPASGTITAVNIIVTAPPTATPTATITSTPSATPGPACPEGANDPSNSMGGAKLILVDTPNNHGICEVGDIDWFKFAAIGGKVYTPDITRFDAGLDLVIELYDASGNRLAFNDDYPARTPPPAAGGALTPVPTRDIGPRIQSWRAPRDGMYYIRIRDAAGVGGSNKTYTLVVFSESYGPTPPTIPEICRDLYEEDGLPEEAKLITSNEVQPGRRLCPTGDADWVKFFGKAGKVYYLYTDTRPYRNSPPANPSNTETQAGADTTLLLTDRDGASMIAFNDDIEGPDGSSLDSQIRFVPSVDGFYFAQIKNTGDIGNQYIRYDLVLSQCAPGRDDCGRARTSSVQPTAVAAPTQTPISFEGTATPVTATPVSFLEQTQAGPMVNGPLAGFADRSFESVWRRTDAPVSRGQVTRSWMWGPRGLMARSEGYLQAPGGLRQVQYFDKGRMEVSDPRGDRASPWFVTSGLLVVELVSGRMQVGDTDFVARGPADVPIAGDSGDPSGPTYASFSGQIGQGAGDRSGALPGETIGRAGQLGRYSGPARPETRLVTYVPQTGHNIPQVFWSFLTSRGTIEEGGRLRSGMLMDWVFTMGYPISEPYWARVRVGGVERDVLIQAFERRVLTYDPSNSAQWQVEMGNVGRHYYRWRYGEELPAP